MIDQSQFVREMADVLYRKCIDPLYKEDIEIGTALVCAGWSKECILRNFDSVKHMATIRFGNDRRRKDTCLKQSLSQQS